MKTNKKIILFVTLIITLMLVIMLLNFSYNFKDYGVKAISDKANLLAKIVEHSLTAQMQTNVIKEREIFLKQLEDLPNINKIWLSRGEKVIDIYGKGFNNEIPKDEIDKEVLKNGKKIEIIDNNLFSNSTYRVTIPYKAISYGVINCMKCHINAKEGDTLGAISIEISIDEYKKAGIRTIINSSVFAIILIFILGFLINYLISPFLKLFDAIKQVMKKAQKGDYSYRIASVSNQDAKHVSSWINTLLDKLQETLENIDTQISVFLSNKQRKEVDTLVNVKNTVDRLADVYKFRKTIELDDNLDDIYKRLAFMIRGNLYINNFNILEADTRTGKISAVYISEKLHCNIENGCRADKTNNIVDSTQFEKICKECYLKNSHYLCIPFSISNDLDLIISIYEKRKENIINIRENIPYLNDYIDAAKSVIISNKLMNILEKSAKTDGLTGLYNRKYLEEEVNKIASQANRVDINYGVLMLDIDHFKMVNDTYGHDTGDKAIKIVAQTLIENIRDSDVAIRYGGEEFIILLYNCDIGSIEMIAQKIRKAFEQKDIPVGNTTINKTISIGASIFPKDDESLLCCIKNADLALYEAKNTGRNKVVLYTKELIEKNDKK